MSVNHVSFARRGCSCHGNNNIHRMLTLYWSVVFTVRPTVCFYFVAYLKKKPQNKTKPVQYNNLPGSHVFLSTQHLQIVCTDCLEITFHLRGGTKMGPVQQCGDYGIETLRHPELRCVLWIKLKLVCAHTCVVKF